MTEGWVKEKIRNINKIKIWVNMQVLAKLGEGCEGFENWGATDCKG